MNEPTFNTITPELETALVGQKLGKIFSLSRSRFAIDFRLPESKYLFISVEPNSPRIYLIKRRFKDLEAQSKRTGSFLEFLRSRLSNGILERIEKYQNERILKFTFSSRNDVGKVETYHLIGQFTGRSSNLFILDKGEFILDSWRENSGLGQEHSEKFAPPKREESKIGAFDKEVIAIGEHESLSEALDHFYLERESEISFQNRAKYARSKVKKELQKRTRLLDNLRRDQINHGDAKSWKRSGDLLLANIATAKRADGKVFVTDYFDDLTPTVEIEIDPNLSLSESAEAFFKKYTKAKNARDEISRRLKTVKKEIDVLEDQKAKIEIAVKEKDENYLLSFESKGDKQDNSKQKQPHNFSGARRFTSSDGVEILVGRRAKDNDYLTFRLAKSLDYWFHAADYPGSHVVVRNPNRGEISQTALLEAAQIAAFYSQAKSQAKVAVHYTQKKFVNKPKGAAPGLVSLASFKTILVEPKIENSEPRL